MFNKDPIESFLIVFGNKNINIYISCFGVSRGYSPRERKLCLIKGYCLV